MEKRNIQSVAEILVDKTAITRKEAGIFASVMFEVIQEGLDRDGIVKVKGLGTFKVIDVEARESVNVNTGERVLINSHSKITFTPDTTMKELVNKPFSQFETVVLNNGVTFEDMAAEQAAAEAEAFPESLAPIEKFFDQEEEQQPTEEPVEMIKEESQTVNVEPQPSVEEPQFIDEEPEIPVEEPKVIAEEFHTTENKSVADTSAPLIEITDNEEEEVEVPADDSSISWLWYSLILLVLIAAAAYGGYWYGRKTVLQEMASSEKKAPQVVVPRNDSLKTDTLAKTGVKPDIKPDTVKVQPSVENVPVPVQNVQKTEPAKESAKKVAVPDPYEQKDVRVRTGAYKIMGTDRVVTVKPGETLLRISNYYLGEGMSCYIEVYNDLSLTSPLKAGQKIKIPKLELKKRLRMKE